MKYLTTGAGQSQNGPLWMHAFRRLDLASYMKKVADKNTVTKGHTCLSHAERTRVHAYQQHLHFPAPIFAHIVFMWFPCIHQRVVSVQPEPFQLNTKS